MNKLLTDDDIGKLILRLTVGGLILLHGINKLAHWSMTSLWLSKTLAFHHLPEFFAYGVLIGEVVAPLLLIAGFYTRIGGLIVVANMIFALFLMHSSQLFSLNSSGGWAIELQAFYLFGGLALVFLGAGKHSVDRILLRKKG